MERACATLKAFATHTRHEIDDESPSKLAQKWLAVHVRSAPAALVYTHISNDYALVNLRTHEPPLSSYHMGAALDPATFVYVMKTGYPRLQPIAEFGAFRDALFPKPADQEQWVDYYRDTHWKERAYYMAVQCGTPYALVEAVTWEDVVAEGASASQQQKDAASNMYTRLLRHARLHPDQAYGAAQEVGSLIGQLALPLESIKLETEEIEENVLGVGDHGPPVKEEMSEAAVSDITFAPPAVEHCFPQPVDCSVYRKAACLPPSFATHKLVKQMILARVGASAPTDVLARSQIALAPRSSVDAGLWEALKTHIPTIEMVEPTPAVRDLYTALYRKKYQQPGTAAQFVHAMLDIYAKDEAERSEMEACYVKKYPQPDAAVIKSVV
jgi:hypothetical protein